MLGAVTGAAVVVGPASAASVRVEASLLQAAAPRRSTVNSSANRRRVQVIPSFSLNKMGMIMYTSRSVAIARAGLRGVRHIWSTTTRFGAWIGRLGDRSAPNGVDNAGSITVLPPTAPWPPKANVRLIHQDVPGFPDDAELGDWFGASLA